MVTEYDTLYRVTGEYLTPEMRDRKFYLRDLLWPAPASGEGES